MEGHRALGQIPTKALCLACRSSTVDGDATGPKRHDSSAKATGDEVRKPQSRAESRVRRHFCEGFKKAELNESSWKR